MDLRVHFGQCMNLSHIARSSLMALAVTAGTFTAVLISIRPTSAQTQPDNTAANKRDQNTAAVTADDSPGFVAGRPLCLDSMVPKQIRGQACTSHRAARSAAGAVWLQAT